MSTVKGEENTSPSATTAGQSSSGSSNAGSKRLDTLIDCAIRIKTVDDEEITGKLFTVDPTTGCNSASNSTSNTFRIIKISHIKELISAQPKKQDDAKTDSIETAFSQANSAPRKVYIDQIKQREAEAIKLASQQAARTGVGVTKEAQAIFDALSKTLPCRWAKDTIVVMDEIIITPPYNEENCKANASSAAPLARVKKVLEGEKRRLQSLK
ncbi:hypothetical protein INT43_007249 [Umbelopsis isabellina]|uniref:AD domain-containing protein n=1 Tax=Mortierella isabellina TaxID=91625 RepID=A0A8H7UKL1_MORIS|nr:hypothetical protein INT43_007249 [Umbelopsis isabellina]